MQTVTKQRKTNRTPIPFTDTTQPASSSADDLVPARFTPTAERIYADGIVCRTYRSLSDHQLYAHLAWDIRKGTQHSYTLHTATTVPTPGRTANAQRKAA